MTDSNSNILKLRKMFDEGLITKSEFKQLVKASRENRKNNIKDIISNIGLKFLAFFIAR